MLPIAYNELGDTTFLVAEPSKEALASARFLREQESVTERNVAQPKRGLVPKRSVSPLLYDVRKFSK
ncbi:hypothetical protein CH361_19335 [Leptospira brenneri]|nr:hypothetical protein CH361_19335 [Leptospira brenneri]